MIDIKQQAFMFAVALTELDYLQATLKKYCTGKYLLCGETAEGKHSATNGEHVHIWCEMTDKNYHKYSKIVKEKYKLVGRATVGQARQYGKLSKIKNLEKLQSYMMKDQDEKNTMVRTNMDDKEIETMKSKSFKKAENQQKWDKILCFAHDSLKRKWDYSCKKLYDDTESQFQHYNEDENGKYYDSGIEFQIIDKKGQTKKSYSRLHKKAQVEWMAEVNEKYRELHDGLPMTKNTALKILFKFEQLSDYDYMENLMRYI